MDESLSMSSKQQELSSFQQLTKLFGNMMSELQINYLASLEERVSDMEETSGLSLQNSSEEMI